jgi:hypothetical protein
MPLNSAAMMDAKLAILIAMVLVPFNDTENSVVEMISLSPNATINKIALMAHLVIYEHADTFWTQLCSDIPEENRPAALDQQVPFKVAIAQRLISLANAIKDNLDYSTFSEELIGEEAHTACSVLSPSSADFTNCEKELLSLKTKMVNLHDTLLQNLDSSGGNLAVGCKERRLLCWDRFIGASGRSKDVELFYCVVLWEGKELRWTSRRLAAEHCVSSSSKDNLTVDGSKRSESKKDTFSKREIEKITMLGRAINSGGDDSSGDLTSSKKRVLDEQAHTVRAKRLQEAMDHSSFQLLSQEQQEKIKSEYFSSLLG